MRVERYRLPEDPNRAPIWLIGLTDLITILLAFFILLYSTSEPRTKAFDTASQSLRDRFGDHAPVADRTGEAGTDDAKKTWKSAEEDAGLNLDYLYSLTKKYLASNPALQGVTVWRGSDAIILSFGTEMGFEPARADMSPEGKKMIAALTPFLNKLSNRLEIVGHADAMPLLDTSHYQTNWELSLARAYAVAQVLADKDYSENVAIMGRGTGDMAMLPADLPTEKRNALARRVDLRLSMVR